ncbi:hypothetical protein [Burkholderia cenocepacia]|uniref:hypothetical protein n=1 Tax=Burkholderia cenocepacia TaxID=95486 RepID=UPI0026557247|nr:hypothetical protein [Burkholderia cenocepacia]MDN7454232.1 hypothetical protein [Burkholderia cenocepacia]
MRALFAKYAAGDVFLAINVSDLWPPNISSQVKHQLAFAICVSIPPSDFAFERIDTYERFSDFSQALIDALPDFPSLEDYWPESDWGDIMWIDGIDARPTFYGGTVQRIPDFIEAFRIIYGESGPAVSDMRGALRMQSDFLEKVRRPEEATPEDVHTGHIEAPPRWFWDALQISLPSTSCPFATSGLLATLGTPANWHTETEFGDAVMKGEALPWLGVQVGESFVPLSLRNSPTVVLDYWSEKTNVPTSDASHRFVEFLARRIADHSLLAGPLQVVNRRAHSHQSIAAVILAENRHYVIVFADRDELAGIEKSITEITHLVSEDTDWAYLRTGTSRAIQVRDPEGVAPTVASLEFIIVAGFVTTKAVRIRVPKQDIRIISMVDAITLFDAMHDIDELNRFWDYEAGLRKMGAAGMSDLADLFGSFRDSHGQIIAGAIVPTMIMLDPHWGSNWRYTQLREYWNTAPTNFPDDRSAWNTEQSDSTTSLRRATARNLPRLDWSCRIGSCTAHFILDVNLLNLSVEDGRMLETFVHCAADCLSEREPLAASIAPLPYKRIVIECITRPDLLATLPEEEGLLASNGNLLEKWQVISNQPTLELRVRLVVNLARVRSRLQQVEDASFEVECATTLLDKLAQHAHGRSLNTDERNLLAQTTNRQPRFVMRYVKRTVDVPDYAAPKQPTLENYKVARRTLAELLMSQGVAPGRYELDEAKTLINASRAAYRDLVHKRLRTFDRDSLITYCVQQIDTACTYYDKQVLRVRHSLAHEVDYDREQSLAEAHSQFTRDSRNFRYAIEAALFLTDSKPIQFNDADVLEVIAMINWLFVLYQASDVLHNGIDVGGLLVDHQYVPEVFYSEKRDAQEEKFSREMAALRMGSGVAEEDQLETPLTDQSLLAKLDAAFLDNLGFTYNNLLEVISTLVSWVAVGGGRELSFGYVAPRQDIARVACCVHEGLNEAVALRVIDFLVLEDAEIRQLIGRTTETEDVPVWEHSKRAARYTIRPLIRLKDGRLLWGAAIADRAARIWTSTISAGYLPADFPWPAVRAVVGRAKKELEDRLEDAAHAVAARATPYSSKGIDFKYRFPKKEFPDVGDFDVLAYWPDGNRWLICECKYNQPAFCLKDARRLRDRVFGVNGEGGQFVKIEGRRQFFLDNVDLIRQLLEWPEATVASPNVTEMYICKDLHWSLRFPPYDVPTQFTQIDTFGAWLSTNGYIRTVSIDGRLPLNKTSH